MSYVSRTKHEISEEQAEELRDQVPHAPIKLPLGHTACATCGIAVPVPADLRPSLRSLDVQPVASGFHVWCSDCQALHQKAQELIAEHPSLARNPSAAYHIEYTLIALDWLGKSLSVTVTTAELTRLMRYLAAPGSDARWRGRKDACAPRRFGCLRMGQRQRLRTAYAAVLREKIAHRIPPVEIEVPPPVPDPGPETIAVTQGCMMCGLASIQVPAVWLAQNGGLEVAQRGLWRELTCPPAQLGGSLSAIQVIGHVCPACAKAMSPAGGPTVIGSTAMERALMTYLRSINWRSDADHLQGLFASERAPRVMGYGALVYVAHRREANPPSPPTEPWGHLSSWLQVLFSTGVDNPAEVR